MRALLLLGSMSRPLISNKREVKKQSPSPNDDTLLHVLLKAVGKQVGYSRCLW